MMLISILTFVVFLSVLVLVHELGHFIAARRAGIWVEEFGFGIPPKVFGIKRGETIYSINLLPFGGFVRLHGEEDAGKVQKPKEAFVSKSWGVRMFVVYAGIIMNMVLAILAFGIVYTFTGIPKVVDTGVVRVIGISSGSPAETYGIKEGDFLKKVGDKEVFTVDELTSEVIKYKDTEASLFIERNGQNMVLNVTPRSNPPKDQGALGVVISSSTVESFYPPVWQRPFYGAWYGLKEAFFWGQVIVLGLFKTIQGLFVGQIPKDLVGPTGLYAVTSEITKQGIIAVINWTGIISVNLAVLNILPFPALDGGRGAFLVIEKVFGKKVKPKVENTIHTLGLILLISMIVAVTYKEIRIITRSGLSGYIDTITQGQGIQ